jgi:hypothetical protein
MRERRDVKVESKVAAVNTGGESNRTPLLDRLTGYRAPEFRMPLYLPP